MQSVVTISPKKFRKISYDRVLRGYLGIKVNSNHTLNIHTVPAHELNRWLEGKSFHGTSFLRQKYLSIGFNYGVEFDSDWCLILDNISDYEADVEYEVFERWRASRL